MYQKYLLWWSATCSPRSLYFPLGTQSAHFLVKAVIHLEAFVFQMTKCGPGPVSYLWVLQWPKGPGASHTSLDIDTLPPPHQGWHLIHSSRCSFGIPNGQLGIMGKYQCCVSLGHLTDMREIGRLGQVANFSLTGTNGMLWVYPIGFWVCVCFQTE